MVAAPALPSRARGRAALVLAGFLFGSTFLLTQGAIERASVLPFLAVRCLIAAVVLVPLAQRRPGTPNELRHGFLAGLTLLAGFILQTASLRYTTSATAAFITYLLVVMVPLIALVRFRRVPPTNVVVAVIVAVCGLYVLSGGIDGIGKGELLAMGCAFFFALHIVVLGEVAEHHDPIRLTMWQVLTVGAICLVPGAFAPGGYGFDARVWVAAAFCGVGATAGAFWCMTWAQRVVPESEAAIILLVEPVSAGILGELIGEHLGLRGGVGAVLILVAVLVAELGGRSRPVAVGGELVVLAADPPVDGGAPTDQPPHRDRSPS